MKPTADGLRHLFRRMVFTPTLALERQGVTRETLKANDRVVVTGNPGRVAEDHRLRLRSVRRVADGWHWGEHFD